MENLLSRRDRRQMLQRAEERPKIKIEKFFLVFVLLFGMITAAVQPVFSPPDESHHLFHSYLIFHDNYSLKSYENVDLKSTRDGSYFEKFFIEKTDVSKDKISFHMSFKDLQWLPQALGVLVGRFVYPSLGVMVLFGRLFNLLFYSLAIFWTIKKAKLGQWLMAAVALLPISLQQSASLSYDVVLYVAIFTAFSLFTNLWARKDKLNIKSYVYLALTVVLLLLPKSSVLLFGLYFVTLPARAFGQGKFAKLVEGFWTLCRKLWYLLLLVFIVAFVFYLHHSFAGDGGIIKGFQVLFNSLFRPDLNPTLDSTMTTGIIGNFGSLTFAFPSWFVILDFIFLFILAFSEKTEVELDGRIAISSILIYLLNILVVVVVMYGDWTINQLKLVGSPVSYGSQGRYYTPFLLCLIPVGIYFSKWLRVDLSESAKLKLFNSFMIINFLYFIVLVFLYNYTKDGGVMFFVQLFH